MSPSLPWNPSKPAEGDGSAELTVPARAVPAAASSEPATTATVTPSELEMLTTKAMLLSEEFGQVGGDWHPTLADPGFRSQG